MHAERAVMTEEVEAAPQQVLVSDIHIESGFNHRRHFDEAALESLAESIGRSGVIQSLLVRPKDGGGYALVAGERRLRAARMAGLTKVPAIVRVMTDSEALAASLAENGEREGVTVGEEAKAAQRALHLCDGDKGAAATLLGWTKKKLDSRLLLVQASDAVIDALAARKIHFGHAELLSQLEREVQDKLLPRLIESGATVETLKQQMTAFTRDLGTAIFDTTECNSCPHNSSLQASLFEHHVGEARCANHPCWQQKTEAALAKKKTDLENEVPMVWLDRECPSDKRTVLVVRGPQGVGQGQYESGCKGCAKYGAVLKTEPGNAGQVVRDVCFDLTCHTEKVKENAKTLAEFSGVPDAQAPTAKGAPKSAGASNTTGPTKKATSSAGTPKKVSEVVHKELRQVAADAAPGDGHVRLCFEVMALETMASISAGQKPAEALNALLALDGAALLERKNKAIAKAISENKESFSNGSVDQWTGVAQQVVDHLKIDLSGRFSSNGALLEAQTKSGMEALLADCEFWRSMDGDTDEDKRKSLKKLLGGKRDAILKAVQTSKHDFSGYVPSVVTSEIENIKKVTGK